MTTISNKHQLGFGTKIALYGAAERHLPKKELRKFLKEIGTDNKNGLLKIDLNNNKLTAHSIVRQPNYDKPGKLDPRTNAREYPLTNDYPLIYKKGLGLTTRLKKGRSLMNVIKNLYTEHLTKLEKIQEHYNDVRGSILMSS